MSIKKQLGKTDIYLPPFSVGTSTFGNMFGDVALEDAKIVIQTAINRDKILIDTSPFYGHLKSEEVLGQCLKGIPRENYYLCSKVGRIYDEVFDHSSSAILNSLESSLSRLNVDYLDIYLLHDVEFANLELIVNESLPTMNSLRKSGKVRYIGFSCQPIQVIKTIIEHSTVDIDVVLSYCQFYLISNSLSQLFPLLKEKSVGIINASLLGSGLLCQKDPPKWHSIYTDTMMLEKCRSLIKQAELKFGYPIEKMALQYGLWEENICTNLVGVKNKIELDYLNEILANPIPNDEYELIKSHFKGQIEFHDPLYDAIGKIF